MLAPSWLVACGAQPPPELRIQVRELGPLTFAPAIRGRDGGYSALMGDAVVFTFGDTALETPAADGERWRSSTWCYTLGSDASDGLSGLSDALDELGAPLEFLPFTAEEAAFNRQHNRPELGEQRRRIALWPGPVVVDPRTGEALVFYGKLLCGSGAWDFTLIGHSLARWPARGASPERPELAPGTAEPTLLFGKEDVLLGQGAFVDDGWIYAYGVRTQQLSWPCLLARARFDSALTREGWQYFAGSKGWVSEASSASEIMQAAPQLSVHYNPYLACYVAFYGLPLENGLALRTAPRPEGPWSAPRRFHEGIAPVGPDQWNYCGLAHAALQREGGRVELMTYYRTTGFLQGEIRLLELRLEK